MLNPQVRPGDPIDAIPTPAMIVEMAAMEANLNELARLCKAAALNFRPHVKTHKTPEVGRLQMASGAIGLTCAKLGEVEAMVEGGLSNLLLTTAVVGRAKLAHLAALAERADITVVADCEEHVEGLADAGAKVGVLVDLNVGHNRTGVLPADAIPLARRVLSKPGLRFRGIQAYDGHSQHVPDFAERSGRNRGAMAVLAEVVRAFRAASIPLEIVSTGGTGTISLASREAGVTEIQPGSYVFMDHEYLDVIEKNPQGHRVSFQAALFCLAAVVSNRGPERLIIDAGLKALTTDYGPSRLIDPAGTYKPAGEEHGRLFLDGGGVLPVGSRVRLQPSHCCTTMNLHDWLYGVRDGRVEAVWRVTGRGAFR